MESEASSEVQRPQRDEDLFMNHVKNGNGVRKNSANDAEKFELWAIGARSMIVGGQTNSEKEYINHWRQAYKDFIFEHETHKTAEYKQWRRERPDKGRHWDAETREVRLNIPPKLFQYYEQLSKGRTPDPELGEWPLSKTHNDWLRMIAMMDIDPYQLELSQPDWNRSSTLDPNDGVETVDPLDASQPNPKKKIKGLKVPEQEPEFLLPIGRTTKAGQLVLADANKRAPGSFFLSPGRFWTSQDDDVLLDSIMKDGERHIDSLANKLQRTVEGCRERYQFLAVLEVRESDLGPWTDSKDAELIRWKRLYEVTDWSRIAFFCSATVEDCQKRWAHLLGADQVPSKAQLKREDFWREPKGYWTRPKFSLLEPPKITPQEPDADELEELDEAEESKPKPAYATSGTQTETDRRARVLVQGQKAVSEAEGPSRKRRRDEDENIHKSNKRTKKAPQQGEESQQAIAPTIQAQTEAINATEAAGQGYPQREALAAVAGPGPIPKIGTKTLGRKRNRDDEDDAEEGPQTKRTKKDDKDIATKDNPTGISGPSQGTGGISSSTGQRPVPNKTQQPGASVQDPSAQGVDQSIGPARGQKRGREDEDEDERLGQQPAPNLRRSARIRDKAQPVSAANNPPSEQPGQPDQSSNRAPATEGRGGRGGKTARGKSTRGRGKKAGRKG